MARLSGASTGGRGAEIRALLRLDTLPGVGPATARRLVEAFGSARAALAARAEHFRAIAGAAAEAARNDPEAGRSVDSALALAARLGMCIVLYGDAAYAPGLLNLVDPPPLLFLRGRADLLGAGGVAVVGSRRATARGKDVARRLGRALAGAGVPVVSGLARGVDAAAHRGALEGGGATVAVLGCGAERAYPASHERLFRRIVERGLVVSEFPPGTEPFPQHFPRRNRILAALARSVVVVEAGRRSGALITVDHALDLGLDVYAVPGPIDVPSCEGSNRLLRDGARPLVSLEDFVRELGGDDPRGGSVPAAAPAGDAGRILAVLDGGPVHADEVARRAEIEVGRALALLSTLEMRGWVEQVAGMRFRRAG